MTYNTHWCLYLAINYGTVRNPKRPMAEMDPRPEANLEPAPIDLPAATVARARDLRAELQAGTINRSQFDPQMNTLLTDETVQAGANYIRPYGEPLAFTPVQLQTTAEGNAALFRARFATGTLTWVVRVSPRGNDERIRSAP
jgi:hypothetical protein